MKTIIGKKLRVAARKEAGNTNNTCPVIFVDDGDKPRMRGESYGWETRGGKPIYHPSAYAKVGWSSIVYRPSSLHVEMPRKWCLNYLTTNFPSVVFAGHTFYVTGKHVLRHVERTLSKYEQHVLQAPEEKRVALFEAALHFVKSNIIFAQIPNTEKCLASWLFPGNDRQYDSYFNSHEIHEKMLLQFLGHTPEEMALKYGAKLTRTEALAWFDSSFANPKDWLVMNHSNPHARPMWYRALKNADMEVIRWALAVDADPNRRHALLRQRTIIGPHGEELSFNYISKLDEIKAVDLANGIKSGVKDTFERAAKRVTEEKIKWLKSNSTQLHKDPEWWPGDTDEYKILRSAADLVHEGNKLYHCVAQYAGYVKRGESIIVSITPIHDDPIWAKWRGSTVEFNKQGIMQQHLGYQNSKPSDYCKAVLNKLVDAICATGKWMVDG